MATEAEIPAPICEIRNEGREHDRNMVDQATIVSICKLSQEDKIPLADEPKDPLTLEGDNFLITPLAGKVQTDTPHVSVPELSEVAKNLDQAPPVECDKKIENQKVEDASFDLTNDVSKEEQETTTEVSQESSALESITETTDDCNAKVTEKIDKSSLTQGDDLAVECKQQLQKENKELPVTEISTGGIIGHESSVNSSIEDKFNSGHDDKATSSVEERNTGADVQAVKSEDTEEKEIDTPETEKEVIEVQGTPKSSLISHEEGSVTADSQEIIKSSKDGKCIDEIVPEIVSKEEIEEVSGGGKTPSISLALAGEATEDELMVRHEVQNEGGQQKEAVLRENEEHTEGTLQKVESKLEKEEDTLHLDPEENKASDLSREVADSQGILDEQTDYKTDDPDEMPVHDIQNDDGQRKKAELCEYEEQPENTSPKVEFKMENEGNTLQVASEEIKVSNSGEKVETSSLEEKSITAESQGILDEQTYNKTVDATEVNDREFVVEQEVQNEDDQLKKAELCEENEQLAENTVPKIETEMKEKDTLPVVSDKNKASELCQEKETSSLEQQSLTADPQGTLDEQTCSKIVDADTKEENPEVVETNVSKETDDQNPLIQVDAPQMKHEEHLEVKMEPSKEASSEKQIQIADLQEISSNKTEEGFAEVADTTEEDKTDVATNISQSSDHELENALEAKMEDQSSSKAELDEENEKCTEKETEKPSTESSSVELIQTEDLQKVSSHNTEKEVAKEADTEVDSVKDIARNEETSPTIKDDLQQSQAEVSKANDHEPTQIEDESSLKTEVVKNEKCPEEEIDRASTEASSEKQIQTPDPQETLSEKTKEQTSKVADTKEESTKDIAAYVSNPENEATTPIAEDGLQLPSHEDTSNHKVSEPEPENTPVAEFRDESSKKSEFVENEKCVDKEMNKPSTEDTQKISSDKTKEEIAGVVDTKESTEILEIATNVPKQENEDTLEEDESQMPHLKEASTGKPSENELEDKFEDKNTLEAEMIKNEKSTEKGSVKEDSPIDYMHTADKDIELLDPRQERVANVENITTNASNEGKEVSSQGELYGLQNSSLSEGKNNVDYTTFTQEGKLEDKNTIITELKERGTEETLTKEDSVEPLQVISEEGASGKDGEKTGYSEKESLDVNHGKFVYDQKEEPKFDKMDLKVETPETKDIAADTPGRDGEEDLQVESDSLQNPSLEEPLKNESTAIPEDNKPLQRGLGVNDNIVVKTDQNVSAVEEDTGKNCVEQLEEDGTTKGFPEDEKHTESELEERGCEQEKVLLDETEDVKEPTSNLGATDFITESPESSDLNALASGKELTVDKEELHAGKTGDDEAIENDEEKSKVEEGIKQKTSELSHETAEATDRNVAILQPEAPEGDSALKLLEDGQEVGSVSVEKTSDSISFSESDTGKEEKLKAVSEINNDLVPEEEDNQSKKNEGEDGKTEYHDVSSFKEDAMTEKQLEGAKEEMCGTEDIHETEKEVKVSEDGIEKDTEQRQENLLVNESLDRSIDENQVEKSIEDGATRTDAEETCAHAETKAEDSEEGVTTKSHQENDIEKEEIKIGDTNEAKKDPNETEKTTAAYEESAVQGPEEEKHENLRADESLDRGVDQSSVEKSIEEGTTIADAEETDIYVETKIEESKEGITAASGPEEDTKKEEINIGETHGAKKEDNEAEKASEISKESAQYVVQVSKEEQREILLANESLDRSIDQNQVKGSIEEGTAMENAEETHVYAETNTEDSKEGITAESGHRDDTEKEQKDIEETREAKKEANEAEKSLVRGPKEEQHENLLVSESLDRSVDQNQVEKSIAEGATVIDAEETHVYAPTKTEDSTECITTGSSLEDNMEKNEISTRETNDAKKEVNETEKVPKVSEESPQHESLLAKESLDRNVDHNQVEKVIEEDTTVAAEETHAYAEMKTEDSKEGITTGICLEDGTEKEETKIEETCEANKDANVAEKISEVSEETAQCDVQEAKEVPSSTMEVTTVVNTEKNYGGENVHLENKIEDSQEKVVMESFSEDHVKPKEMSMEIPKAEKVTKTFEEAEEKAGEGREEILANAETSLNENEMDSRSKEITNIEAHQPEITNIERNLADSKEDIATESQGGDEVKQEEICTREIHKEKNMEIEREEDVKAFEEPEEDITTKESIDRNLHQEELENSTKEVATMIHAEEAQGTGIDCVHKETNITDSREEVFAESYPIDEAKKQETIEKEICEVKEIVDEPMKEPKIIEEAKQGPQEDITENKSINRSLNIEETILDTEQKGEDVYLDTKAETKKEEIKEKEICEVQNIADEAIKVATPLLKNEEVHAEDTEKCTENLAEKEIESYPEETDEMKKNATEKEKEFKTFQGDAEQSMQGLEDNLPENVNKSLHQNEQGRSLEEMMTIVNTGGVHGIVDGQRKTGAENSKEMATESHQKDEVISKEINIEDICEAKKSGNETESVSNDSEKVSETVVQEPEELEKGAEVVTAAPEIATGHGVDPMHIKTEFQETKEEVISSTAASTRDEVRTRSYDFNSETIKDEIFLNQNPDVYVISAAAGVPERLDKNIICEAAPTGTPQNTEGNIGNEDAIMKEQLEGENKGENKGLPLRESTHEGESEKLDQKDEIFNLQTDEENLMVSEDACKADTHKKPTEGEKKNADVEAKHGYSSHVEDAPEISQGDSSWDMLDNNENFSRECCEEKYPNKGNESQISTVGEDVEPVEQTSEPTRAATAIPLVDQLGLLKAAEVENHGEEEVSEKTKEKADNKVMEAEYELLKNHGLPPQPCIRESDAKIAQSDVPLDLHTARDIEKEMPKLSERSIGIPIQENPVDASPVENKKAIVSSADQEGNIIQHITGHEETPLFENDKHVAQEVDCSENVNAAESAGKNNNVDEGSARQETTRSMETPDVKDTGKPSLSYLFNASTKENRQAADDLLTSKESTIHRDDHQAGEHDNVEHNHAKQGEEKCGDEESDEKTSPDMAEAPVMVDAGDADAKVAHKKSHNILSGVGSKVKHSISKVKKAITGKSSHHPKPSSPK